MAENSEVKVVLGGEEVDFPKLLTEEKEIFDEVMHAESLLQALTVEEKEKVSSLLPNEKLNLEESLNEAAVQLLVQKLLKHCEVSIKRLALSPETVRFGVSPLNTMWEKLSSGSLTPETHHLHKEVKDLAHRNYKLGQAHYFVKMLQELVVSRQEVLQRALFAGSLENMWKGPGGEGIRKKKLHLEDEEMACQRRKKPDVDLQYHKILRDLGCVEEGELEAACSSGNVVDGDGMSEAEYRRLLRKHRRHRKNHQVSYLSRMEKLAEKAASSMAATTSLPPVKKPHLHQSYPNEDDQWATPPPHTSSGRKSSKVEQEATSARKEAGGNVRRGRKMMQERCQHERTTAAQAKAIYKVYSPIDKGTVPESPLDTVM